MSYLNLPNVRAKLGGRKVSDLNHKLYFFPAPKTELRLIMSKEHTMTNTQSLQYTPYINLKQAIWHY
jgi:hypothetical protein